MHLFVRLGIFYFDSRDPGSILLTIDLVCTFVPLLQLQM